jgi:hypothetical protein
MNRERDTDKGRHGQEQRQTWTGTETDMDSDRNRDTDTGTGRHTDRNRDTDRWTQMDRGRDTKGKGHKPRTRTWTTLMDNFKKVRALKALSLKNSQNRILSANAINIFLNKRISVKFTFPK